MKICSLFIKLNLGLRLLKDYAPTETEIEPIPNYFPNGAPAHSLSAYLAITVELPVNKADREVLLDLGWKEEQEGEVWVFLPK